MREPVGGFGSWNPLPLSRPSLVFSSWVSWPQCKLVEKWTNNLAKLPSRKLTYPTWGKETSSSNMPYQGDMLIPWRVPNLDFPGIFGKFPLLFTTIWRGVWSCEVAIPFDQNNSCSLREVWRSIVGTPRFPLNNLRSMAGFNPHPFCELTHFPNTLSHTMYGAFSYIWLIFMVNVGKYAMHGWYGPGKLTWQWKKDTCWRYISCWKFGDFPLSAMLV